MAPPRYWPFAEVLMVTGYVITSRICRRTLDTLRFVLGASCLIPSVRSEIADLCENKAYRLFIDRLCFRARNN